MAIKNDDNSQDKTYPNLFSQDTTSLKYWAEEDEKAKKALEAKLDEEKELTKLRNTFNDNNLDLSWHGVRVMIIDKSGENAIDTSIKVKTSYSARISRSDPNNTSQWLRLEKTNRDDLSSPWVIRNDGKDADRRDSVMWDNRDGNNLTFSTDKMVLTNSWAHFYISCDSKGFYRFKDVITTHYIGISTVTAAGDPPETNGLKGIPVKDGIITNQQLWRLERLPTDAALAEKKMLMIKLTALQDHAEQNNLDSSWHNTKVNIFNKKGLALDTGHPSGDNKNWEPWGYSWDRGNPHQCIRLEKLRPDDSDSTWTLSSVAKSSYIYDNNGGKIYLSSGDPKSSVNEQWRIGVDNSGGLRIMNWDTKRYLELVSVDGGDGTPIHTQPRNDGDGKERQTWRIERLIDDSLVDAQGTRSLDSNFNDANGRVTITNLTGKLSLDLGGSSANRAYFGLVDSTNNSNDWRRLIVEKVDRNSDQSPWKIKAENSRRTYMGTAPAPPPQPPNTEIAVVPNSPGPNTDGLEYRWYFRSTSQAGAFRIQNANSKFYLEVVEGNNDHGLFVKPLDVSAGDKQLFRFNKL